MIDDNFDANDPVALATDGILDLNSFSPKDPQTLFLALLGPSFCRGWKT